MSNNFGPYGRTPINRAGYLDHFKPRPVPVAGNDVLYTITSSYTHRPDLLANDLYGDKNLWWVFAQRNPDVIKDPIYDFVAGIQIYLPQGANLRQQLGK
jgi:hypothetical protein